ncbi:MAG: cell division protein FtsW [Paenibacillus sp.]|jgi:cell division protein FtsW|nr:cell division protein FtsW [Paenibacillus sp.]
MQPSRRGTPDFLLLLLTFLLVGFGLVMVFSASSAIAISSAEYNYNAFYFVKKQAIFAVLGTLGMFFLMNVPMLKLRLLLKPYFIVVMIMLALVPFIGNEVNGARSWFQFPGFGIQPSEFAKLAVILYLAGLIYRKGDKIKQFRNGLAPSVIIVGVVAFLIMLQPDFGSMFILVLTASLVIVVGGANMKHIMGAVAVIGVVVIGGLLVYVLTAESLGYKMDRITCYLDPWSDVQGPCYQIVQSMYAFGHGDLTGAGIGQSIQKLHYLPEAHNDFIFAIIGEELGFIGSVIFLLFYLAFIWRGLLVALRSTDTFGNLVGIGIVGLIGIQAFVNMGGVTGAIPMTGVTLPFISAGGSSLVVMMSSIGILLSISREYNKSDRQDKPEKDKKRNNVYKR